MSEPVNNPLENLTQQESGRIADVSSDADIESGQPKRLGKMLERREDVPLLMMQGGDYVVIGHCEMRKHEHGSEIRARFDTKAGHDAEAFLMSGMCGGISIGGVLDPAIKEEILNHLA